jgi:hypothetical protein
VVMFPLCYVATIEMLKHLEIRHASIALPFLIIMSAYAIVFLFNRGRCLLKEKNPQTIGLWGWLAISAILYSVVFTLTEPRLLSIFPGLSAQHAHGLALAWLYLFLGSLGMLTYHLLQSAKQDGDCFQRGLALKVWAFAPVLSIALVYQAHVGMIGEWQEWKVRLDSPQVKIQQRIVLPEKLPEFTEAYLKFDMQGGPGHNYDLVITLNGQEIKRYARGVAADEETVAYLQGMDKGVYQFYLTPRHLKPNDVRQWFSIPVDRKLLIPQNLLAIEVKLENGGGANYADVYGDYPPANPQTLQPLPAFGLATTGTSFWKFVALDEYRLWTLAEVKSGQIYHYAISREGDPNLTYWQRYVPQAAMTSQFFNGAAWSAEDLSSEAGRQFGQYRIRLVLKDAAGNFWVL